MTAKTIPDDAIRPRRGREMTRLETFTDAAFAFAVTLLAISIDEIPKTYEGLIVALKGTPAFAASFALLLLYWRAHQNWSQRYGLEDLPSVLLTFAMVLVIMVYVYPLKIMAGAAFHFLSDGWLPSSFVLEGSSQFQILVSVFGVGFFLLSELIAALYGYAWLKKTVLGMQPAEAFDTGAEALAWTIVGLFGLLSIALVWTLPGEWLWLAPWVYCLLGLFGPTFDVIQRRMARRRLEPASGRSGEKEPGSILSASGADSGRR